MEGCVRIRLRDVVDGNGRGPERGWVNVEVGMKVLKGNSKKEGKDFAIRWGEKGREKRKI